jgi:predicted ATPase
MSEHINKYYKGSEWRKWDLHFHAPSKYTCAKNDQYIGNNLEEKTNIFISELKNVTDVSVIGITDYFSIEGYKMVNSRKAELEHFELILPNIELRITPVTTDNRKINLHIIPNTDVLSTEDIERFLYKFEFGPDKLTCKEADLIQLGKKNSPNISDEEAFKKGLNQFAISYDKFFEVYNSQSDRIKENLLIGVSNNSGDGASGIKDIQGIRDIIYSGVHFIFSAQTSDRQYFTGNSVDSKELIKQKYGSLKPCIHGSDYHGSKDGKIICIPDLNRFCWIKADPTFEGLKQVIYEPEDRVIIQANKPEEKAGYQIIESIEIDSVSIFNSKILFNPNLNSIIGGRSSGKSVLLGAIAKKVKTSRPIELSDKEYQEYVQSISNTIKVIWKDSQEENNREVEYFEQGYMHKIARDESQLNKLINDILIQKGKEQILDEYKRFITDNSKSIAGLISDFFRILQDVKEKEQKARDKGDKKGIEDEIVKLKDELKQLSVTAITDEEKQKYEQVKSDINTNTQQNQLLINDINILEKLKTNSIVKDSIDYELVSVSQSKKENISAIFDAIKAEVEKKWRDELDKVIETARKESGLLVQKIADLEKDNTFLKVMQAYKDNIQLSEYEAKIKIQNDKLFEITSLISEIDNLKKQLTQTREKIKAGHKAFYEKIITVIPQLSDSKDGLEIKAKWKFESNKYKNIFQSSLNLSGSVNQGIANFEYKDFADFEVHQFMVFNKLELGELTLKGSFNNQSLASSLLSTNFFSLKYDIEYEGDDFKKMSDGKKAFVVLKLLLDFNDKNCPILIDQPEDDLDNRAIYNDLVQYLRKKKKLRQIIVATHNPNIVVGADSELVICANQNGEKNINSGTPPKKFQYVSGSLEHTFPKIIGKNEILESQGTREHVCEVLEGGNVAFKLREKKYSIKE